MHPARLRLPLGPAGLRSELNAPLPSGAVCGLSITSRRSAALRRTVAVHASQQRVGADTIVHHVIDLPSEDGVDVHVGI